MSQNDGRHIMQDFEVLRARQIFAIVVALCLVLFLALLHRGIRGEFSQDSLSGAQVVVVAAFIGFSGFNWRCPSCKKYLGNGMNRRVCRKCGSRLR
jgi:hypothetical protein